MPNLTPNESAEPKHRTTAPNHRLIDKLGTLSEPDMDALSQAVATIIEI
jgi:hypothetical protein